MNVLIIITNRYVYIMFNYNAFQTFTINLTYVKKANILFNEKNNTIPFNSFSINFNYRNSSIYPIK